MTLRQKWHNKKTLYWLLGLACLGFLAYHVDPGGNARRHFDVCINNVKKEECKDLLHFDVLASVGHLPEENHYSARADGDSFRVELPTELRIPSYFSNGQYQINIEVSYESFDAYRRRWQLTEPNQIPINKEVGNIFILSESSNEESWSPQSKRDDPNFKKMGSIYSIPRVKNKPIFFNCARPFTAVAGNLVTHLGCDVRAEISPHVYIEYPIYLEYLQEWESIHKNVLLQLAPVLTVTHVTQGN